MASAEVFDIGFSGTISDSRPNKLLSARENPGHLTQSMLKELEVILQVLFPRHLSILCIVHLWVQSPSQMVHIVLSWIYLHLEGIQ